MISPLQATQQALSFSGPTTWTPGASVVLAATDTFSGYGIGTYGFSYWLQVNTAIAPFLTITNLAFFPPFPHGYSGPFPILFNSSSGTDPGFTSDAVELSGAPDQGVQVPDGSYHFSDITFGLAANAPAGTYTLRITTAAPRNSIQVSSDFNDEPFPQVSFVFNVVPEPSTLALLVLVGVGAGAIMFRRRKS
jgi:hypothetical protein